MILSPCDVTIDGSFLQKDDAEDILAEVESGWSWHWENAIGMDKDKEIHL